MMVITPVVGKGDTAVGKGHQALLVGKGHHLSKPKLVVITLEALVGPLLSNSRGQMYSHTHGAGNGQVMVITRSNSASRNCII